MKTTAKRATFDDLRAIERQLSAMQDSHREWEKSQRGPSSTVLESAMADARNGLWTAMREAALDERLESPRQGDKHE